MIREYCSREDAIKTGILAIFAYTGWRCSRLNTKLISRELEVKDLVKDFSDGVSQPLWTLVCSF